jgi:hypothetical protein
MADVYAYLKSLKPILLLITQRFLELVVQPAGSLSPGMEGELMIWTFGSQSVACGSFVLLLVVPART